MATEVAAAVAVPVVNSLFVRVKRELKFWASSPDYVREMHAKVKTLDGVATDMKQRQADNNRDRKMVPTRVPGWLKDYNEIKARADKISKHGVGCSNLKTRYRAGKDSAAIVEDIDSLMKELDNKMMVWTEYVRPLGMVDPPRPSSSVAIHEVKQNKNNLKSRELIFNDALKSLEADSINTQMMALYGMGGVGKTTMMKDLEEAARDKYIFKYIVKVEVGRNPNLLAVQQEVARFIQDTDTSAESLRKRFKAISEEDKMKVLVILDNVWEVFNLNHIGLTSPLPNGFKLLLTSREESVCKQMGVEASSMFKMTPLEEPEGKKLFWETTGLGSVSNIQADLYKIGEEIIKRCGGLPLAITAIASALGDDKEKDEWADALSRLNNTSVDDYNIREVFKISYENLKEDDLKAIFLLSGLFPEANNISKEDLLWYGWGLKFFQNVKTIAEARRRVNTCVNKLTRSNLLIKGDGEGSFKIHDLVRDFVLSNFTDVKQASINLEELNEEEPYDRILLKCEDTSDFPVDFNHPNLTLLMVMGEDKQLKFRENSIARMQKLEVVAYEKFVRLWLPQQSTNLRTFSIRSCTLVGNDIYILGNLVNLEVLSIDGCEINKLPFEIEKLKRLKLLNVTGYSGDLCVDVCVLQSLERLKELYLGDITFTNANFEALKMLSSKLSALGVGFSTNKEEAKYMCFEKLERFMVSIGCQTKPYAAYDAYGVYEAYYEEDVDSCKNTLSLVISKSELIEYKINKLFSTTEILALEVSDMNHLEDILAHPPQNSFCNLKALDAYNCTSLAYLFTISVAKGLTELETLKIRCCPVLKSLINSEKNEVEVIEFRKLKILYMVDLPELVSLCDAINIVIDLPQLVELHLRKVEKITSIFHENNINTSAKLLCMNTELVMPKLENLKVHCMQNLREIWPCEITSHGAEVDDISMLKRIEVGKCDSLLNIFPSNPMRLLGHLEELTIERCGSIEVLFNIDLGRIEQLTSNSSLTSITVNYSKNLREVFRIKEHVKINYSAGLLIPGFQAIEHIKISSCERFINIVTPTTANFDMRALKVIDISYSEGYEQVKNSQEERTTTTSSEEEISQVGALMSIVALPSSFETTLNFHNLCKIKLYEFKGLEVVFEIESRSNYRDQSVTTQQQKPPPLALLPYLEYVCLELMEKMTHVWKCSNWNEFFILHKNQPQLSSFQNLKKIRIRDCNSIKFLFSPLMVKLLSNLEEIDISSCKSMEEVVSSVDEEMITSASAHSTTITFFPRLYSLGLYVLDNLKHIGPDGFHMKFPNLKILDIQECPCLENVLTFSTIKNLKELETLTIRSCNDLKVIVREDYGEHTTEDVVFPRLKSVELSDLPNLEGFLLGMNTSFQLPLLDDVKIGDCPRMMAFTSGLSTTPRLKYIHTELGKYRYNPEHGLNFYVTSRLHQTPSTISEGGPFSLHNCIEMEKQYISGSTLILSNEFLQLQNLETITAKGCDNAEEVFEVALEVSNNESQTVVSLPKLREVNLELLQSLKYIWKNNQCRILEFPNLTRLSIFDCRSLKHVFTYSMVGCVMQLQELHVERCTDMKVIVKKDKDCDSTSGEITFPCLKSLKLRELKRLKGFCLGKKDFTLPSLDAFEIKGCKEISVFTKGLSIAPRLRVIETGDGSSNVEKDINTFVVTKRQEIIDSMYPWLEEDLYF